MEKVEKYELGPRTWDNNIIQNSPLLQELFLLVILLVFLLLHFCRFPYSVTVISLIWLLIVNRNLLH